MEIPKLGCRPIKQEEWYKQIQTMITKSDRPIDKMSISEILTMYRNKRFLCDTCGKDLQEDEYNHALEYHIIHLINPKILWSCRQCLGNDLKNGRVLATVLEKNV